MRRGETPIRIPKPFVFGQMFGTIPERFFEYIDKGDPKAFDGLATSLMDNASPFPMNPLEAFIPTAIKPIVENYLVPGGWNLFRDRPIVPKGKEALAPPEQYGRYTSEALKYLGEWMNHSPAKLENMIYGWFGGTGRYALQGADALIRQIKGEERKLRPSCTEVTFQSSLENFD